MCDQLLTEHALSVLVHFISRSGELYTARFSSAASMHLRLDDPEIAAQFLGSVYRCVRTLNWNSAWDRNAVLGKQPFRLIFVEIHSSLFFIVGNCAEAHIIERILEQSLGGRKSNCTQALQKATINA